MENPPEPPVLLRICPSCNSPIEIDHTYCEICGEKMPELPACRNCGARFIAPVKFCERCGTPFIPDKSPEAAADEVPASAYLSALPATEKKSGEIRTAPVPASSAPSLTGNVDDALFLRSAEPGPVQKEAGKAYRIGGIVLLGIVLAVIWFIVLPMLTGTGGAGLLNRPAAEVTGLPGPAMVPSTPPALEGIPAPTPVPDALAPRPTQLLPEGQAVFFQVRKNPVTAKITVTLAGGPGIDSISSSEVKVTRPDGAVASGIIFPFKGAPEIMLDGSRETDRVEIITKMTNGRTYRVYDNLVPFQQP